jgi:hypothetical protein
MKWVILYGFGADWKVSEWLPDGHPKAGYWEEVIPNGESVICCRWEPVEGLTGLAYDSSGFVAIIDGGNFVKWADGNDGIKPKYDVSTGVFTVETAQFNE